MSTVVVPFRGIDPKRRLDPLPEPARRQLAVAMLADVLAAAATVGDVVVVAPEQPEADVPALYVPDPKRGQGAAVRDALDSSVAAGLAPPYLVVNADLPCVTPRDLLALAGSVPADGIAVAAAHDGTTNALGLARPELFEPVYGPGSAARFEALAPSLRVDAPNLVDDVDVPADLGRLRDRLGPHTRAVVATLDLGAAA
jgi:2-phospho-L-lactate guanylyltransferase